MSATLALDDCHQLSENSPPHVWIGLPDKIKIIHSKLWTFLVPTVNCPFICILSIWLFHLRCCLTWSNESTNHQNVKHKTKMVGCFRMIVSSQSVVNSSTMKGDCLRAKILSLDSQTSLDHFRKDASMSNLFHLHWLCHWPRCVSRICRWWWTNTHDLCQSSPGWPPPRTQWTSDGETYQV